VVHVLHIDMFTRSGFHPADQTTGLCEYVYAFLCGTTLSSDNQNLSTGRKPGRVNEVPSCVPARPLSYRPVEKWNVWTRRKAKKRCHGWVKKEREDPYRQQKQEATEDNQRNVERQTKYDVVVANLKGLEIYVARILHVLHEWVKLKVKVKEKFTLEQATKAQR
jgi:hypothetical protein